MNNNGVCPVCKSKSVPCSATERMTYFYECPICGRFEVPMHTYIYKMDINHLASYLFYHCYESDDAEEYRYNTTLNKEDCDKYRAKFENGINVCGLPVHMDNDLIENWYPRAFSERVDRILLYLNNRISHIGQSVKLSLQELISLLFIDRYDEVKDYSFGNSRKTEPRDIEHDCVEEVKYMLQCLEESGYIKTVLAPSTEDVTQINLTPSGYKRVDELQKNTSFGRNVLVAMKFGKETNLLREAIRKGITDAGYIAIFIDEVQHNDFITPELLKHIRDSKFVVVDLTHQNNGAYFEEGYAMGLGKPVIQLCKKDQKLHFDIAQKNTIMWENEDDIPAQLTNRIKATID